jgi:hypothetical protein
MQYVVLVREMGGLDGQAELATQVTLRNIPFLFHTITHHLITTSTCAPGVW